MLDTPSTTLKARNLLFILSHLEFSMKGHSVLLAMELLSMSQGSLEKLMALSLIESAVMEEYWSLTGHICCLICTKL